MNSEEHYRLAAKLIRKSNYTVAFTGSGISAESGIPTFRGSNGLWSKIDPMKVATPEAFHRDPYFVWEWYRLRINKILHTKPNQAHKILAKWEEKDIIKYVITQNVDNLHREAGSKKIIELHGNILRIRCINCTHKEEITKKLDSTVPRCSVCGSIMRPDVVWFGEALDPIILANAFDIARKSDLMLVIGTSAQVYPAAAIPIEAWRNGAKIIEINPEETSISNYAEISFRDKATYALIKIDKELSKL